MQLKLTKNYSRQILIRLIDIRYYKGPYLLAFTSLYSNATSSPFVSNPVFNLFGNKHISPETYIVRNVKRS